MENEKQLVKKEYSLIDDEETYIQKVKDDEVKINTIPKKALTYNICMEAVKKQGHWLSNVPEEIITEEMCVEAVKSDTIVAPRYIPERLRTKELYKKLFKLAPKIFWKIPKKFLDEQMIIDALKYDGNNLEHLDEKMITSEYCNIALENNPMAIQYVPKKYITEGFCLELLQRDYRAFIYILEPLKTLERCIDVLNRALKDKETDESKRIMAREISAAIPERFKKKKEIIDLERKIGARWFIKKSFDKERNIFYIQEYVGKRKNVERDYIEKKFKTFEEFYEYLEHNLKNADLYDYDFDGIDLNNYDISGAYIKSDILFKYGLYDDEFYNSTIGNQLGKLYEYNEEEKSIENQLVKPESVIHELTAEKTSNANITKIHYVSDIHLCHKLKKRFPVRATKKEIQTYVTEIVDKMVKTARESTWGGCLFVGGDVSTSFEISKMFYRILKDRWHGNIIAIIGNHELWNLFNEMNCKNVDEIIDKYAQMFQELNITFLQNELIYEIGGVFSNRFQKITDAELLKMSEEELRSIREKSSFTILGGLGFSGLNPIHNATCGLYGITIQTLEEDRKETEKFTRVYDKVNKALGNEKVIVFTHTPKENWSNEDYNSNWIYVSGHTHRNEYYCTTEKTVYADNQIGYERTNIGLKFFEFESKIDYFKYYEDGIYRITREQYLKFNRTLMIPYIDFNVVTGTIYMLKRNNLYMFLYQNEKEKLYLLKGGQRICLKEQDVEYYYNRMLVFKDIMAKAVNGYNQLIKNVSNEIKLIGGDGTIHGCIVDIDFYNHLYVNPNDGKITPYFALSMVDKFIYKDVKTLLKEKNKLLYNNYIKLIEGSKSEIKLIEGKQNGLKELNDITYLSDTLMYSQSNQMKTIQYLTEMNVIRFWNDEIIDKFIAEHEVEGLTEENQILRLN